MMMMKPMAIPLSLAAALLAIVAVSTAAPARAPGRLCAPDQCAGCRRRQPRHGNRILG